MTQREKILGLLRRAGSLGVNSYGFAREIALQLPVRIKELQEEGHSILHRREKDKSMTYILLREKALESQPESKFTWIYEGDTARRVPIESKQEQLI